MNNLLLDVRFALRAALNRPGFTAIALFTLALGIGANTAIFSVADAVLLRPLPFRDPERLVVPGESSSIAGIYNVGYLTYSQWKTRVRSFESIAAYRTLDQVLTGDGEPEQLYALRASHELLPMLGVGPMLGRLYTAEEDHPASRFVALLSAGLWQRRFGADPHIVGRTILLNERAVQVIGVLPAGFAPKFAENEGRAVEVVMPLGYDASMRDACASCRHLRAIARIKPGIPLEMARAELSGEYAAMALESPDPYKDRKPVLLPLRTLVLGKLERSTMILLIGAGLVLLIACANVASLLLTRATQRRREMAVRAALGAGFARLIRQMAVETIALAIAGGSLGVLLALWITPALLALAPGQVPSAGLSWMVLLASGLISLIAGLLAGAVPAWRSARLAIVEGLRDGTRASEGHQVIGFGNGLVAGQLAVALVLVVGTVELVVSLQRLLRVDAGFDPKGLITANVNSAGARYPKPEDDARFIANVVASVRTQPGLEMTAATSVLPMSRNFDTAALIVEGQPMDGERVSADRYVVTPEYLRVMQARVMAGRDISAHDGMTAPLIALLNESGAERLFGDTQKALGKRIQLGTVEPGRWCMVVGIVADVHQYGLDINPAIQVYEPEAQQARGYMTLVVRTPLDTAAALAGIKRAVAAVDPTRALSEVHTMDELFSISTAQRRFLAVLLTLYGLLALALALVGVFGLISVAVERRAHELGIRMALGANRSDVLRLVFGQAGGLLAAGIALGTLGSLAIGPLLRRELYGIGPNDPGVLATVALLIAATVAIAALRPALKAIRLDPARVLGRE